MTRYHAEQDLGFCWPICTHQPTRNGNSKDSRVSTEQFNAHAVCAQSCRDLLSQVVGLHSNLLSVLSLSKHVYLKGKPNATSCALFCHSEDI